MQCYHVLRLSEALYRYRVRLRGRGIYVANNKYDLNYRRGFQIMRANQHDVGGR